VVVVVSTTIWQPKIKHSVAGSRSSTTKLTTGHRELDTLVNDYGGVRNAQGDYGHSNEIQDHGRQCVLRREGREGAFDYKNDGQRHP